MKSVMVILSTLFLLLFLNCGIFEVDKYDLTVINRSNEALFSLNVPNEQENKTVRLKHDEEHVFKNLLRGDYKLTAYIDGYIGYASIPIKMDGNKTATLNGGKLSVK